MIPLIKSKIPLNNIQMVTHLSCSIRLWVFLVAFTENNLNYMLPTYIAYMIEGFIKSETSVEDLQSQVAYDTGIIDAMNRVVSVFACLFWGSISDRIGIKYSLIIILGGKMITSVGFGLSTSFAIALIWRMIAGLFSGSVTTLKTAIKDQSDDTNAAVLFAYFSSGSGFASVIGPLIGGTFSNPSEKFSIFNTGFFQTYPYALPQFIQ